MRRSIAFALAVAAALTLPAAGAAAQGGKGEIKRLTVKQCQAERNADRAAFRAAYGKNAMRNCIKANRAEIRAERRSAVRDCRAERREDPEAFRATYGTNSPRGAKAQGANRNALGKCVRAAMRAEIRQDVAEFRNAAQECRAERAEDPEGFRGTYGTNAPRGPQAQGAGRNAFGKCVRTKVREADNGNGDEENGNGEEE